MAEACETETVPVEYFLHVTITGISGEQEWGPFGSRAAAESEAAAVGSRDNVQKVRVERRAVS